MDPRYGDPHPYHHGYGGYGGFGGGGPRPHEMFEWLPALSGALVILGLAWMFLASGLINPGAILARLRPAPDPVRTRWQAAVGRYETTSREFADYECNPGEVLRRPELADVTRPATARFVDAYAEATALVTDDYPGPAHAVRFAEAAEGAQRAWRAAADAAERVGRVRFAPGERALLDQILALLAVAGESEYEAERHSAYQRARGRLAELERRTGWALPRRAVTVLEHRARGMLPPADPVAAA
jgi:hypothetical protein